MEQTRKRARFSDELEKLQAENAQLLTALEESIITKLFTHSSAKLSGEGTTVSTRGLINDVQSVFRAVKRPTVDQTVSQIPDDEVGNTLDVSCLSLCPSETDSSFDDFSAMFTSDQPFQVSPVLSALMNYVILFEIFNYLPFKDLKSARQVCKTWLSIASERLLTKNLCKIKLSDDPEYQYAFVGEGISTATISALRSAIKASPSFPCTTFEAQGRTLSKLISFFEGHGEMVKSLIVTGIHSIANVGEILKNCPNLKCLKLCLDELTEESGLGSFFKLFPNVENRREIQLLLPSLQFLEVVPQESYWNNEMESKVVSSLIQASPKLLELQNFDPSLVEGVFTSQRFDLVKSLKIKLNKDNIEYFLLLANHPLQLQQLTIDYTRANEKKTEAITKILKSSAKSLKRLTTDPLGLLGHAPLGVCFQDLEHISINHHNLSFSLFPGGFGFTSAMLPSLTSVQFRVRLKPPTGNRLFGYRRNEDSTFSSDKLRTVKVVQILNNLDKPGLQLVVSKFPCIQKLKLKETYYPVKNNDNRIWNLLPQTLEHLEIYDSTFNFSIGEINYDSVFTGISTDACKTLREAKKAANSNPGTFRRTKSWIGDLKQLKTLKIVFHLEETYLKHKEWIFTPISALYGFECVPSLYVLIAYDFCHPRKKDLDSKLKFLMPFVSLCHEAAVF